MRTMQAETPKINAEKGECNKSDKSKKDLVSLFFLVD